MEEGRDQAPGMRGELTYADLTDVRDFFAPPQADAWGVKRSPFSRQLARMSAELAADGYDLNIKPWIQAGWNDCTFIVEDKVVSLDRDGDSRMASMESEWRRRRAKSLIRGVNPISDLMRAVRQMLVTDLGKTIVLTRMTESGDVLIAISFIGTTQKFFDWFSNFKFQPETGMHYGFLELARQFDVHASRILLPKLAAVLGEETFTLADALIEAAKPDSRFVFWISGHSQGGAIVQTYTHLLAERGISKDRIHGYTFAAPTVAVCDGTSDPKPYPIYNIINADDLVPRVGAQVRLGMDYVYHPDDAFRMQHYRVKEEHRDAFGRASFAMRQIQTMPDMLCWGIAFLRLMREMETDEDLHAMFDEMVPHLSFIKRMNIGAADVAEFLMGKLVGQVTTLTGMPPDEEACAYYEDSIRVMLNDFGAKVMSSVLVESLGAPHRMRPDKSEEDFVSPYLAIVRDKLPMCERGVWMPDEPARCLDAHGMQLLPQRTSRIGLPDGETVPLLTQGEGPMEGMPDGQPEESHEGAHSEDQAQGGQEP